MEPSKSAGEAPQSWISQLRERLANPAPLRLTPGEARQAAVLVPLFVDAGELWTLLTKRSEEMPQHKGQVAFPGGGQEMGEDPWAAALRESREELGLDPMGVMRLGQLDEAATPSGYHIVPCVGAIPHSVELDVNESEIAEVFPVPLTAFAQPRIVEERVVKVDGRESSIRIYHVGRHQVWGLTARIVQNLLERLGLTVAEG
ncbi:MAG: CoA pyrophosphatase [Acidobacteriota bacterium]|nr:CoA pyrophosphatase [Acidobacteriota bacterium]